jgi:processive 1,2-diacylglycerol beta-glucosyltransferase
MPRKRILLLSEGFGAGHTQAAHALSVSLRQYSPEVQTRVMELGAFLHPTLAPMVFTVYRKTVVSQPRLYGMVYRSQYKKSLNKLAQLALHRLFYSHTAEIISQLKPSMIVCTHPFPSVVVSRLKRTGLQIPLCTVITDYDAHGTWISPGVDKYLVSTPNVKHKLMERGIPREHVEVTGIPVHPDFWTEYNRDELRKQLQLNDLPTVLVMGGGWGLFEADDVLSYIATWREHIQILLCLGNNERALAHFRAHPLFNHPNIRLFGFTREVNKLMEVSDLLITKPGGMTCTEGLAKGIPMLFYKPIPGQEEENLQYFTRHGYGEAIDSVETAHRWLTYLAGHLQELRRKRASLAPSFRHYSPAECSRVLIEILNE